MKRVLDGETLIDDKTLGQVPLFEDLEPDELRQLAKMQQVITLGPDTPIFTEGENGEEFYVIVEGQVVITKASELDGDRVLARYDAGAFIGEMSLITPGSTRSASAATLTDTKLLAFSRADFGDMLHQFPQLATKMLAVVIARLRKADNLTIQDLNEKNLQLRQAYAELQAAQDKIIERETLMRELQRAREIQVGMLPAELPQGDAFQLGAAMKPAMAVGGDFYDAFTLPDGRIAVTVGDVSGKGIAAALLMTVVGSLLRAEAARGGSPSETLAKVNRHLRSRPAGSMFATVLYGLYDPVDRRFDYARAGHEFPIVVDADGKSLSIQRAPGQPLGIFPQPFLDAQKVALVPGSTLVLFSDGVTEAVGPDRDLFGHERLRSYVAERGDQDPQQLCDNLIGALCEHHGDDPQSDDITILTIRVLLEG